MRRIAISRLATVVSSGARTIDVFQSAGIATATETVPTELMRTIVQPSHVQRANFFAQKAGQIPSPNA